MAGSHQVSSRGQFSAHLCALGQRSPAGRLGHIASSKHELPELSQESSQAKASGDNGDDYDISATSLISSWVVRQAIDLPVISAGNNLTIIIWMTTTTVVYDLPHIRMQKVKRELQFSP